MDSATLANKLASFDSSAQSPVDIYNKTTTALGIPDARTRVQGLQTQLANTEQSINNVDPSVTGRTSGSLVTEAQRGRLVNAEKQPLLEAYGTLGKNYSSANGSLADLLSQAQQQTSLTLQGQSQQRSALKDQYDSSFQKEQAAISNALSARKGSGSGSAKPTATDIKGSIQQGFQSVVGADGYVSPQDYAQGLQVWLQAGLPRDQYNKQYKNYRNPSNDYYDYAIKQAGL